MRFIAQGYRAEIDGFRAFAVIAVIINHFNKDFLPSGYLGVDIFFVISGYVITSSLIEKNNKNFFEFIIAFYKRRIRRLFPALFVFVCFISLITCLFNPYSGSSLRTGFVSLFGLSNFYLFKLSTNYFSDAIELNSFSHTWSLGVEVQFYLLFPFIFWFSGLRDQTKKGYKNFFITTLFLSSLSLFLYLYFYETNQSASYFLMPSRFWEISIGCFVFLLYRKRTFFSQLLGKISPFLILILMAGILNLPRSASVIATISITFLSSILILCLRKDTSIYYLFTNKFVVYIGLISYSLYLWHWGVLVISRWTIGIYWWSIPFQILIILFFSIISYNYIENPQKIKIWFISRGRLCFGGSILLVITSSFLSLFSRSVQEYLFLGNDSDPVNTFLLDKYELGIFSYKCHLNKFSLKSLEDCFYNKQSESKQIYLIGDSHAANYFPTIKELFPTYHLNHLTIGGCAYLPSKQITNRLSNGKDNCKLYVNSMRDYITNNAREGDIVFIGQSLRGGLRTNNLYFDHINDLALSLKSIFVPVVLLDGTSAPIGLQKLCTKEFYRPFISEYCQTSRKEVINRFANFDKLAYEYTAKNENLFYAPLRDGLCINDLCSNFTQNGNMIWTDFGHITKNSAKDLVPLLRKRLVNSNFYNYIEKLDY